jgi:hypothetical protein
MRHVRREGVTGGLALLAMLASLSGCSGSAAICSSAGGTFENGTCTRHSASDDADRQWCESHGAIYLAGSGTCAWGEGQ